MGSIKKNCFTRQICLCLIAIFCLIGSSCEKNNNESTNSNYSDTVSTISQNSEATSKETESAASDISTVVSQQSASSTNSSKKPISSISSKNGSSKTVSESQNLDPRAKVLPNLNLGKVLRTVSSGKQMLADPTFGGGFTAMQPNGLSNMGSLTFAKNSGVRPWMLYQNNSKYILNRDSMPTVAGNVVYYQNAGKKISREVNSDQSVTLGLSVYASKEYDKPRTKPSDPWVHLMLEQGFDELYLKNFSKLVLSLDVRVPYFKNWMSSEDYNPNIMCAQHNIYFIVKNTNMESKGFNDWFWFGVNMYDNRKTVFPGALSMDTGFDGATNTMIYTPEGSKVFGSETTHDGKWHSISYDVRPDMVKALEKAKDKGMFVNTEVQDLRVINFYFSWEVSGGFDCEVQYKNVGFFGVK